MKWFKKLFQGRSERETEARNKYSSVNEFDSYEKRVPDIPSKRKDETTKGVFALTTIKNFHSDAQDEYVFESEWVFVSHEKLLEPRFQQHLAKTEALTNLCKRLAKRSGHKKKAMVVAKSPNCHCREIDKINAERKSQYINPFRRILNAVTSLWKRFYNKIKECLCRIDPDPIVNDEDQLEITNSYLCR